MVIEMYQIDAFSDAVFNGNPAAVCPLSSWLDDVVMQAIAAENNLSETVFFVPNDNGFHIRWFTPLMEVELCGHATLAAAFVIFTELSYSEEVIYFESKSGLLQVFRDDSRLCLDFPCESYQSEVVSSFWQQSLGVIPIEQYSGMDVLLILNHQADVERVQPQWDELKKWPTRGIIISARGTGVDFVSRFFAPRIGIHEDAVTGSIHTMLTPYWSKKINKRKLVAKQCSKRSGILWCEYQGDRVLISGHAVKFMKATIFI